MRTHYWGGFVNNRLHVDLVDDGFGGYNKNKRLAPALFICKRHAKEQYEDVRKVIITVPTDGDNK